MTDKQVIVGRIYVNDIGYEVYVDGAAKSSVSFSKLGVIDKCSNKEDFLEEYTLKPDEYVRKPIKVEDEVEKEEKAIEERHLEKEVIREMIQPKYTTVEGHEIVRDGEYETKQGAKAVVLGFHSGCDQSIIGYIEGWECVDHWYETGRYHFSSGSSYDLMRPWKTKEPAKEKVFNVYGKHIGFTFYKGGTRYFEELNN